MAASKHNYEAELQCHLDFAGYDYIREYLIAPPRRWRSDFLICNHSLLLEVDGVLYRGAGRHQTATGFQGDCEKMNVATQLGFRILRFTPKMVMGTATWGKSKTPMPKAIDVIDQVCWGGLIDGADKSREGYAKRLGRLK